jgi:arylsulfatase A-like enzyme
MFKKMRAVWVATLVAGIVYAEKPNVIMFVVDDLNDWVGPLGHQQAITPNLDRLAQAGVTFENAHAPGVFCAPSRTAIWTGLYASTTGIYGTEVFRHDYPELVAMQSAFKQGGYNTFGTGKLYHHRGGYVDLQDWDEYYSCSKGLRELGWDTNPYYLDDVPRPDPYPYSPYFQQYGNKKSGAAGHLEWGPLPNSEEKNMIDTQRAEWVCDVLKRRHDKPFFAAVGLYTPHYPNYVPQKYLDMYERDQIELPPYKEDDLDDLPPAIKKYYTNRSRQQERLIEGGWLKDAIYHYYAAVTYADAMLGKVLDALEQTDQMNNTIIVFWSDQGFHHGEKGEWGKHSLWRQTTHVPFIWAGPGISKGKRVKPAVSLIDLYPTFAELCDLPAKKDLEGVSLAEVLKDPSKAEKRDVFVPHMKRGSYAVVNSDWRYIQYNDGTEELYNLNKDPNEWQNRAGEAEVAPIKEKMQKAAPSEFAPSATPRNKLNLIVEGDTFRWERK